MQDFTIQNDTLEKLLRAHDGDMALLYLYSLRGAYSDEQAADELCRTMSQIAAAREKLERIVAASAAPAAKKLPPPDALPEYTTEELERRTRGSGEFAAVLTEAQKVMGHILSTAELKTLFGIYDYLGLPADVIFMLLNYCLELCREKYGEQRRPTARMIEKEAYVWVNREIMTFEQADEYIRRCKERRELTGRIAELLNIRGRALTPTEAKFIGGWISLGFEEECIALAYDRTVTNIGSLKWSYMDKILQVWHSRGLLTAAAVAEKDPPRRPVSKPAAAEKPIDLNALDKIFE